MVTFFSDMGKLLTGTGEPDMTAMQALYNRFDSEILGPPMGLNKTSDSYHQKYAETAEFCIITFKSIDYAT